MTNYPRDEFDRVPEFNTRVGSHHANGWAQAATAGAKGGKFRWVAIAAIVVLIVGAISYFFFGSHGGNQLLGATPSQSPSASASVDPSASPTPASASPAPSSTIDDDEVLFGQVIGVYNGAGSAGIAGSGQRALAAENFTNTYTDAWVRSEQASAVYYTTEAYRTTAEKVAEVLNIDSVLQTQNIPNSVTVVIGTDNPVPGE